MPMTKEAKIESLQELIADSIEALRDEQSDVRKVEISSTIKEARRQLAALL